MLRVMLFLLIFGPRVSTLVDVIPLASLFTLCLVAIHPEASRLPKTAAREVWIFCVVMAVLLGYAIARYLTSLNPDPYQTMRFTRVLINALGVMALLALYYAKYGDRAKLTIVRHVLDCMVVHSVIMLGMFVSAPFRSLINSMIVIAGDDVGTRLAKEAGTRISGLVLSWDALSGLKSLGLLMLPILLTRGRLSLQYAVIAAPLFIFAVSISGRTGIVTFCLLLPVALLFCDLKRFHRSILPVSVLGCLAVGVLFSPAGTVIYQSIEDSAMGRVVDMFESNTTAEEDKTGMSATVDAILAHYFLPDTTATLFWGSGRSGRDAVHPVKADNGVILNLHNLGIVCWLVLYGLAFRLAYQGWMLKNTEPIVAGCCVLSVLLILIIDAKVAYLYARNGFSVMLVLASLAWWRDVSSQRPKPRTLPARPQFAPAQTRLT